MRPFIKVILMLLAGVCIEVMTDSDEQSGQSRLFRRSRRHFIQGAGVAGLGLTVGTSLATSEETEESDDTAETDADESNAGEPTRIDSCTVIDEPGEYEFVADLVPAELDRPACVMIEADGVTLHGHGHTVDLRGVESDDHDGIAINHGERHEANRDHWNTTIRDVDVQGARYGVSAWVTGTNRLHGVNVRENLTGVFLFGSEADLEECVVSDNERHGIDVTGDSRGVGGSSLQMDRSTVEANDRAGISVDIDSRATVTTSRIVANRVGISTVEHSSARLEDCHICRNERYGAHSIGDPGDESADIPPAETVIRAMNCYWGASNGPSSFGDPEEPYTDPETGAPADGDGDAVTEGLEDGVSNVRFDPYHETTLDDVGADR